MQWAFNSSFGPIMPNQPNLQTCAANCDENYCRRVALMFTALDRTLRVDDNQRQE